jgi:hypothetical protein
MDRRRFLRACAESGLVACGYPPSLAFATAPVNCPSVGSDAGLDFAPSDVLEKIASLSGDGLAALAVSQSQSGTTTPTYFNLADSSLMAQYGWPGNLLPPPRQQEIRNACVAWAVGYSMGSFLNRLQTASAVTNSTAVRLSAADLYAKVLRREPGKQCGAPTQVRDALNVMVEEGVALDAGTASLGSDCVLPVSSNLFFLDGYHRLMAGDSVAIKAQLNNFLALPFAMFVFKDFGTFSKGSVYRHPADDTTCADGGHCMVIVGYDDSKAAYKVMNSWGSDWGDGGFCWISYDTFQQLVPEVYSPFVNTFKRSTMTSSSSSLEGVRVISAYVATPPSRQTHRFETLIFAFKFTEPISTKSYVIRAVSRNGSAKTVYERTLEQLLRASYVEAPLGTAGDAAALQDTTHFELEVKGLASGGQAITLTARAKYPDPQGR